MIKQTWNPEHDKVLQVKFEKRAVHNKFKSEKEGRQVFDDIDWIHIRIPGDNTTEVSRKVREEDKERFEYQWNNYLNREDLKQNGIPLANLPGITPAQIATLQGIRVETIEQLATLQEKAIKNLFEGRELVKRAEKFLKGESYAQELEKTIEVLKDRIKILEGGNNEPVDNNTKRNKRNTSSRRT